MSDSSVGAADPVPFIQAVESIRLAQLRPEVALSSIPAPGKLAPFAVAFAADIVPLRHPSETERGTGRLVYLYDPEGNDAWGGDRRIICFAKAPLETDLGLDPFLADVAWSWLIEALDDRGARYDHASGTTTKTINTGFGELATRTDGSELEVRASWTPFDDEIGSHVEGWADFLCMLAGLPPVPGDVTPIDARTRPTKRVFRGQ